MPWSKLDRNLSRSCQADHRFETLDKLCEVVDEEAIGECSISEVGRAVQDYGSTQSFALLKVPRLNCQSVPGNRQ